MTDAEIQAERERLRQRADQARKIAEADRDNMIAAMNRVGAELAVVRFETLVPFLRFLRRWHETNQQEGARVISYRDEPDGLAPARGIFIGLCLSAIAWILIGTTIYLTTR